MELLSECDGLRARLKEVSQERDMYSRMVGTLLSKYEPIPADQELLACLGQEPSIEELIDELEREMTSKEPGDA
jgi:hypothetical protein